MPELPEVETVRRQLLPSLSKSLVVDCGSHPSGKFTPAQKMLDTSILTLRRRGKFLLAPTDDGRELIIHLGMTGKLQCSQTWKEDPYIRAWWQLQTAEGSSFLLFSDVRRFGRIRVVKRGNYTALPTLHTMGPEPFDPTLTGDLFWELLRKSKRHIKTNLLSQRPIAGVGNIYADEALWYAKINPKVRRLGKERAQTLLSNLQFVLRKGIDNGGTTLRDYRDAQGEKGKNQRQLVAYGRAGEPCLRCETLLVSSQVDARTTTWCPVCQSR